MGDESSLKTNVYTLPIVGAGDGGALTNANDVIKLWDAFLNGEIINKEMVQSYFNDYYIVSEEQGYYCGMWVKSQKDIYRLVGRDSGVSFVSMYSDKTSEIITILSNTEDGALAIEKEVMDSY